MNRLIAIAALVLTMCAGPAVVGLAQTAAPAPQERELGQGSQVVEGQIMAVKGRWIVFSNGTQVAVPDNVDRLLGVKPGAVIRAMYQEREGQKFATSIELQRPAADEQ